MIRWGAQFLARDEITESFSAFYFSAAASLIPVLSAAQNISLFDWSQYFQLVLWGNVAARCDGPADGGEGGRGLLGQGLGNNTGETGPLGDGYNHGDLDDT